MKTVTHQDVIDYIHSMYSDTDYTDYEIINGKLHIKRWVQFSFYRHRSLPSGLVFENICDLDGTGITHIPDDIVLYHRLYLRGTEIEKLPAINVGENIDIRDTEKLTFSFGTYINQYAWATNTKYQHFNNVYIDGYLVNTESSTSILS